MIRMIWLTWARRCCRKPDVLRQRRCCLRWAGRSTRADAGIRWPVARCGCGAGGPRRPACSRRWRPFARCDSLRWSATMWPTPGPCRPALWCCSSWASANRTASAGWRPRRPRDRCGSRPSPTMWCGSPTWRWSPSARCWRSPAQDDPTARRTWSFSDLSVAT